MPPHIYMSLFDRLTTTSERMRQTGITPESGRVKWISVGNVKDNEDEAWTRRGSRDDDIRTGGQGDT